MTAQAQDKETKVLLKTNQGDITVKLYNDTPKHRDNFIKLVNEGWFNGSPFHRVINKFMIQGGQNADGRVDPGYTIPAEIKPNHYHFKGTLAAARMADQVNPKKNSSGSQFYIVQGEVYTPQNSRDSATITERHSPKRWLTYIPHSAALRIWTATTPSSAKWLKASILLTR